MLDSWKEGQIIEDRYRIVDKIGSGGMGTVYKARDLELNRDVAIKLLNNSRLMGANEESIARLRREGLALSKLRHLNVLAVYSMNVWRDLHPYLVLEYVDGKTLKDLVNEKGPLAWTDALKLLIQIVDGLIAAHEIGIIHRDIKPENVLIAADGDGLTAKLADFGLCRIESEEEQRLTGTGSIIGSVYYMAPEIVQFGKVTTAVDVYSLGCLIFELLTADYLFDGNSAPEVIYKHCNEIPPSVNQKLPNCFCPEELQKVITACLSKDAESRPGLATLREQLSEILNSPDTQKISVSLSGLPEKRKKQTIIISSVILAVFFAAAALFFFALEAGSAFLLENLYELLPEKQFMDCFKTYLQGIDLSKPEQQAEFNAFCKRMLSQAPVRLPVEERIRALHDLKLKALSFHDEQLGKIIALEEFTQECKHIRRLAEARKPELVSREFLEKLYETTNFLNTCKLSKPEFKTLRADCKSIIQDQEGAFIARTNEAFNNLFSSEFEYAVLKLYSRTLKATANSVNDENLLAMILRKLAGSARNAGRIPEAYSLFMESARRYLQIEQISDFVLSESFAGRALMFGNDFLASERTMAEFRNEKSELYIKQPYQIEFTSWYCNLYFSQGDYASVIRYILPRFTTLREQGSGQPRSYTFSCQFAALSAMRLGRQEAAYQLLNKLKKVRARTMQTELESDWKDLNILLAAENSDKRVIKELIEKQPHALELANRLWAVAEAGYFPINLQYRAVPPVPLQSPIFHTRDESAIYRDIRSNYVIHGLVDSYVLLKTASNIKERIAAIERLDKAVTEFLDFAKGPGVETLLDPHLFQYIWLEFLETREELRKAGSNPALKQLQQGPYELILTKAETKLRKLLEGRHILAAGESILIKHENEISDSEWKQLWKNYLKSESEYQDVITGEDLMREVKQRGTMHLN